MANYKGNHSQLKKIKKGQSLNPSGRKPLPKDLREAKAKYSPQVIVAKLAQCMDLPVKELEQIVKNKDEKVIDHMIGRIALMGIIHGDQKRFNFILDRMIGKVSDKVKIESEPIIIKRSDGSELELTVKEKENSDD